MVIVEVSIVPLGTKTPSVSKHIVRAIKTLREEKDIRYEITSMGTIIEGDLDRILEVVKKMHQETFAEGVTRVLTTIKIDERRDKVQSMNDKVKSVIRELEH